MTTDKDKKHVPWTTEMLEEIDKQHPPFGSTYKQTEGVYDFPMLELAIKSLPLPKRNIEWTVVRQEANPEVEERGLVFLYYRGGMVDSVIYWSSSDAVRAQRWLCSIAFARCYRPDCGIRLSGDQKPGDTCGNHEEDKCR